MVGDPSHGDTVVTYRTNPSVASVPDSTHRDKKDDIIHSLARGIELLRAFGPTSDRMTIAQAAKATGLTRAGARRILLTLESMGCVRSDGRQYWLTARVLEFGQGFLAQPLWQIVRPVLLSIAQTLNETVSAGVLDGHEVVYTVRTRSSRVLQLELRPGARLPAYASSIGRVLLAALPARRPRALLRRGELRSVHQIHRRRSECPAQAAGTGAETGLVSCL